MKNEKEGENAKDDGTLMVDKVGFNNISPSS
jgi:hypothetical protein